jgi:hypothetical protein
VVFLQPYMSLPFGYYYRALVQPPVVIRNAAADQVNWPGASRIWLFIRAQNAGDGAKLRERVEQLYTREQEFHFFRVALYLYVRSDSRTSVGSSNDYRAP